MTVLLVWMAAATVLTTLARAALAPLPGARAADRWWRAPLSFHSPPALALATTPAADTPRSPQRPGAQTGAAVLALALALECSAGGAGLVTLTAPASEAAQDLWFSAPSAPPRVEPQDLVFEASAAGWTVSSTPGDGWLV